MSKVVRHRLHVLEARDWKQGIISLLAPDSPYRPWRYAFGEGRPKDYVMLVLGTDPPCALTPLARLGEDSAYYGSRIDAETSSLHVIDIATMSLLLGLDDAAFTQWRIDDKQAENIIFALHDTSMPRRPLHRFGHSSLVAARVLLRFRGSCMACTRKIDLEADDATDLIHVHTADLPRRAEPYLPIVPRQAMSSRESYVPALRNIATDWPAVICTSCRDTMHEKNFTSLIEFIYATQHPRCPQCEGRRSLVIKYGEPHDPDSWSPWVLAGGCVRRDEQWRCGVCAHDWAA